MKHEFELTGAEGIKRMSDCLSIKDGQTVTITICANGDKTASSKMIVTVGGTPEDVPWVCQPLLPTNQTKICVREKSVQRHDWYNSFSKRPDVRKLNKGKR